MKNKIFEICEIEDIRVANVIKKTGFSKSYVYDVANGKCIPTIKKARKIAEVLGKSVDDVFPEEKEDKKLD